MEKEISNTELKNLFSQKLNWLHKKHKKGIEEAALDLNLDYAQYYMLLKGKRLPQLRTLVNINKLYGLSMEWWFRELDKIKPKDAEKLEKKITEFELISSFNKLDKNAQAVVLRLLKNYHKERKYK
jgi:transcriptional regulator with XRE-family HTH domain